MTTQVSRVDTALLLAARSVEPRLVRVVGTVRPLRRLAPPAAFWTIEFVAFGVKAAWACLFGGFMLLGLIVTALYWPEGAALSRYDALFVYAVAIQVTLLATRLEHRREALVICAFHVVGTAMEVFKTHVGSWAYPGAGVLFIGGVPLFSGFMYASVGSYLARAWRTFDFRFRRHPPPLAVGALAVAIYANFFTHHVLPDIRLALFVVSAAMFGPCVLRIRVLRVTVPMPLLLGLVLTSGFIYLAENVGTLTATWVYPGQGPGWRPVAPSKWGSWYLLMLLSYALVVFVRAAELRAARVPKATRRSDGPRPSR